MKKSAFCSFRKGDFLAIALVALLALAVFAAYLPTSKNKGEMALIFQDGVLVCELPLHTDTSFEITGDYTNIITVSGGRIRVESSDCPGGDCARSGWISRSGRSLVCLPNRVEIRISGQSDVDFVVG